MRSDYSTSNNFKFRKIFFSEVLIFVIYDRQSYRTRLIFWLLRTLLMKIHLKLLLCRFVVVICPTNLDYAHCSWIVSRSSSCCSVPSSSNVGMDSNSFRGICGLQSRWRVMDWFIGVAVSFEFRTSSKFWSLPRMRSNVRDHNPFRSRFEELAVHFGM